MIKYHLTEHAKSVGCEFKMPRMGDSGYDIHASEITTIWKNTRKLVPTGLYLSFPSAYVGLLKERSSLAAKGVYLHAGVIDSSFRGEVQVLLENRGDTNYHINPGERIAQMLLLVCQSDYSTVEVNQEELGFSLRGTGSFGSTGK
jgi:dUTP pyrophosphatase